MQWPSVQRAWEASPHATAADVELVISESRFKSVAVFPHLANGMYFPEWHYQVKGMWQAVGLKGLLLSGLVFHSRETIPKGSVTDVLLTHLY